MNKETAEKIQVLMLRINSMLDDSVALVRDTCDEEDFVQYRLAAGKTMWSVIEHLLNPIHEALPELKPEQLGGTYKVDASIFEPRFYQSPDDLV